MRQLLFLGVIGLGGAAILVWLGVWQVQRLAWKETLLAEIEARISAPAVPLPDDLEPDRDRFLPIEVTGMFDKDALRILASRKQIGAVYRVIRPFETEGRRILVDTGWMLQSDPLLTPMPDSMTLVGNLHWPREIDGFTPAPDLEANIWFARDVDAMAEALGTDPVLMVLRDGDAQDGTTLWPVDTDGIPNDHLQYAITWFSLAAIWLVMSVYFTWRTRRPSSAGG